MTGRPQGLGRVAAAIVVAAVLMGAPGCTAGRAAAPTATPVPTATPAPVPAVSGLQWQRLGGAASLRTEVAAAAVGSRVYVIGGYVASGATVDMVEVLDTATGVWTAGPRLPVAVNHAMATTINGAVYVFGGYRPGNVPSAAAFRLDPAGWTAVASLPQARAAGTAVGVGAVAYLAGGIGPDGGLADRMLVYDAAADSFTTAPGPPTPREHLGGAGFGGLVYTVGGRASGSGNLAAFEVYDPGTGRWQALADLPTRRGGLSAAATCSGYLVAAGGEAASTFDEAEGYDIVAGRWISLPRMPTARHGLGVVAIGNVIYTLSGGPRPGLHVSGAAEAIDLAPLRGCG